MTEKRIAQFPPHGVHSREFNENPHTLWLNIIPKVVNKVDTHSPRSRVMSVEDLTLPTYRMLMPTTYSTSQNHEWDKFDTIGSKVNEVTTEVAHATHSVTGGFNSQSHKADAPLYYKDSARREWTFEFQFIVHSNAYYDVWLPIQEFLRMSSPKNTGEGVSVGGIVKGVGATGIQVPYMFGLQTQNGAGVNVPVISVENAVITSIQPKYEQPYINGYPSKAELTLTFKDVNVLFSDSYKVSGRNQGIQTTIRVNGVDIGEFGTGG